MDRTQPDQAGAATLANRAVAVSGGDVLRGVVLPRLEHVTKRGGYFMASCPAAGHEDAEASLSITEGRDQPVIFKCHAGCERDDILAGLGLTWADLCAPREDGGQGERGEWTPWGPALAVYHYRDEGGRLLFDVLRGPGKRFIQRRPDSSKKSGWAYQLGDTRRVLYQLPELLAGIGECQVVYLVEGEKDVHALEAAGVVATCNPMGAGAWRDEYAQVLREAIVIIVADRDDPGYAHARLVAESLKGVASAVEIVEAAAGKDAADHLAAGHTPAEFVRIWSEGEPRVDLAPDLVDFLAVVDPPRVFAIGGLLELGQKMILTGWEGHGKSTLVRQLTLCAAAGMHPFAGEAAERRRVLMIDCENREVDSRAEIRPMAAALERRGYPLDRGWFRILHKPEGIDLGTDDGAAWLLERATAHEPDLLAVGSLWRMHTGDLNEESNARRLAWAVDRVIDRAGCGVLIEAHSPHGEGPKRPPRPAGSSLFLRWPDLGMGLMPDDRKDPDEPARYRLYRWRGARRRTQQWPRKLIPGIDGGLPWIAEADQARFG